LLKSVSRVAGQLPLEMPKKRSRKKRARRNNSKANVQPSADADDHPDEEPLMIEGNMEYASADGIIHLSDDEEETGAASAASAASAAAAPAAAAKSQIWDPHAPLEKGVTLDYDSSAYVMNHTMRLTWPCLSFDVIPDQLGAVRDSFPATAFIVAGTQANKASKNSIVVCKASNMHSTTKDDQEDSDEEATGMVKTGLYADGTVASKAKKRPNPVLTHRSRKQTGGGCNRIRVLPQRPNIVASWCENKQVMLYNIADELHELGAVRRSDSAAAASAAKRRSDAFFTFPRHTDEGYAMAWSPFSAGHLLTGDCAGEIYYWKPHSNGCDWAVDSASFRNPGVSVEDIAWAPGEPTVFSSCGTDNSVRIWDLRQKTKPQITVVAHEADVNVIAWNPLGSGNLLLSGSDDTTFKVWDLRKFGGSASPEPVAHFQWHTGPITSVEWHPTDVAMLAVSSADKQVTLWDMGLEADEDILSINVGAGAAAAQARKLPAQLLFVHHAQTEVKELHFHKQLPNVIITTSQSGFTFFRTDHEAPAMEMETED